MTARTDPEATPALFLTPRAEPVRGWRTLALGHDSGGRLAFANVDRDGMATVARCHGQQWWGRLTEDEFDQLSRLAPPESWDLIRRKHPVPHPSCVCGYRVVPDRDVAADRYVGGSSGSLAEVEGWGRTCDGNMDDVPGTVRVSRFRVLRVTVSVSLEVAVARKALGVEMRPADVRAVLGHLADRCAFPVVIVD